MAQTIAVEKTAEFPGGYLKFYEYLNKNIKFPKEARKAGVSGKVFIEFFVKETGEIDKDSVRSISKEEVSKSMGEFAVKDFVQNEALEAEAIRVVRNSPRWNPGSLRGEPKRQKIIIPVAFKR